jgi:preprotein translocase subunit SecE
MGNALRAFFSIKSNLRMSIASFLKETRNEMKHVVWPSRRRTIAYTVIIIVLSLVLGYLLSGFDVLFRALLANVIVK